MGRYAIQAHGLSKAYRISADRGMYQYKTFQETLIEAARRPFHPRSRRSDTFWALDDVSFEVEHGEALGIIGRNGAGKSTLLKLLARITRPTRGTADVYGRMSSLLEVGTGFHPELSGRENVYLNGAILGMTRADIRRRFDEIVAFAEVERFLDTPVKRYSSGMYMRLAFAVAAHLEPEILVVDEVLAVGDAAFQAKSLGKMSEVARSGRTVLFVSHNVGAVGRLCDRALLLEGGRMATIGPTAEVLTTYLGSGADDTRVDLSGQRNRTGTMPGTFQWAELRDGSGALRQDFSLGDSVTIRFGVRLKVRIRPKFEIYIRGSDGLPVAQVVDEDSGFILDDATGDLVIAATFRDIRLFPDSYYVSLTVQDRKIRILGDLAQNCLVFRILDGGHVTPRVLLRSEGLVFLTPGWIDETGHGPSEISTAPPKESVGDRR
jgi:lipopolysaccharide transport system ATP-binding protein